MTALNSKKITCDGSAHKLSVALGAAVQAKWFQILADPNNASAVSIGGADVETEGFPLVGGAADLAPVNGAEMFNFYDADKIWYFGAADQIFYVLYPVG
jgi:hypothetical protein